MRSLRARLTLRVLGGLALVFAICGAAMYVFVRAELTQQFDDAFRSRARAFAALSSDYDEDGEETVVTVEDLPRAVAETVRRELAEAETGEIVQILRDARVFYKVEFTRDGMEQEILVSGAGQYLGEIDEFNFAFNEAALPEFQPSANAEYYQVWDEDGETVARSPSLEERDLVLTVAATTDGRMADTLLPDGRKGRGIALGFDPATPAEGKASLRSHERFSLVMARSRGELDHALGIVGLGTLSAAILLGLCSAGIVYYSVRRGLRPLTEVADAASRIGADSLDYRFRTADLPEEITPICARLNEVLARLEEAFRREQRFTSDAAHELRTPIAELRLLAEVGLRSGDANRSEELRQYFQDALAISLHMERLVTALLALARSNSGSQAVTVQSVDLVELIHESWAHSADEAASRELAVRFVVPKTAPIESDRALLSSVLTNLFSNAAENAPRGGMIRVDLNGSNGTLVLDISNTNNQLDPDDLPYLFDPFWRKDKARTGSDHSGVGLSIVAAVARALGIGLCTNLPTADVFQLSLRFDVDGSTLLPAKSMPVGGDGNRGAMP